MSEKNKNVKNTIDSFLPDRASDDPNVILKKDKKLYTIVYITIVVLVAIANLIAIIIGFCTSVYSGLNALFIGTIVSAVVLLLVTVVISMAHNISRITRANIYICNKLMKDEKRILLQEKKKNLEEQGSNVVVEEELDEDVLKSE